MHVIRFVLSAFALAGLCATAGGATEQRGDRQQAELQRTLAGLHPGAPRRCVSRHQVSELRGYRGEILYVAGRNKLWRNRITGSCPGLARNDLIVTLTRNGDYCEGDIVQTRARLGGMISGSCALGAFVPYTR